MQRGQKQEGGHRRWCCTGMGGKRKKPTFQEISHILPPDSSESAALIPDWLGKLSGLETTGPAVGAGLPPDKTL